MTNGQIIVLLVIAIGAVSTIAAAIWLAALLAVDYLDHRTSALPIPPGGTVERNATPGLERTARGTRDGNPGVAALTHTNHRSNP